MMKVNCVMTATNNYFIFFFSDMAVVTHLMDNVGDNTGDMHPDGDHPRF